MVKLTNKRTNETNKQTNGSIGKVIARVGWAGRLVIQEIYMRERRCGGAPYDVEVPTAPASELSLAVRLGGGMNSRGSVRGRRPSFLPILIRCIAKANSWMSSFPTKVGGSGVGVELVRALLRSNL